MGEVVLSRISKQFDALRVLEDLDLRVEDGEFVVLLGPSGCGKTTALRIVAGLERPTAGRVVIAGQDVTHQPAPRPRHRHGLPELRPVPPPDRGREHRLPAQGAQGRPEAAGGRRPAGRALPRGRPPPAAQAAPALRRATPADRPRPGHHPRTGRVPHGRAAVQPGREAARDDARGDQAPPAAARHDHDLRDARPGRGAHDGGPGLPAQGRSRPAVRAAAGGVRPPGEPVRRRVRGQPADERPRRGARPGARGRRRRGQPPSRSATGTSACAAAGVSHVGVRARDLELVRRGDPRHRVRQRVRGRAPR